MSLVSSSVKQGRQNALYPPHGIAVQSMYSGEWGSTVLTKGGGMRISNLAALVVQGKAIKKRVGSPRLWNHLLCKIVGKPAEGASGRLETEEGFLTQDWHTCQN